jgi:hypothetical protein
MFSYSITHIDNEALDNIVVVKYTGSEEQYNALGITKTFSSIYYYACDEGFINYWNAVIRPEKGTSICDISKETFNTLYSRYIQLTSEEKSVVDTTLDKAGAKIGDSMQELVNLFYKFNTKEAIEMYFLFINFLLIKKRISGNLEFDREVNKV